MARERLSRLQRRILAWLAAEEQRTRGTMSTSHEDLLHALPHDKGNLSHSLVAVVLKTELGHITRVLVQEALVRWLVEGGSARTW